MLLPSLMDPARDISESDKLSPSNFKEIIELVVHPMLFGRRESKFTNTPRCIREITFAGTAGNVMFGSIIPTLLNRNVEVELFTLVGAGELARGWLNQDGGTLELLEWVRCWR